MSKFPCSGCGLCCAHVGQLMSKATSENIDEPLKTLKQEFPLPIREDGSCSMYDHETKRCSDYKNRPIICNIEATYERFFKPRGVIPITDPKNIPPAPVAPLGNSKKKKIAYWKALEQYNKDFVLLATEKKWKQWNWKHPPANKTLYYSLTAQACNQLIYDKGADKSFIIEDVVLKK